MMPLAVVMTAACAAYVGLVFWAPVWAAWLPIVA